MPDLIPPTGCGGIRCGGVVSVLLFGSRPPDGHLDASAHVDIGPAARGGGVGHGVDDELPGWLVDAEISGDPTNIVHRFLQSQALIVNLFLDDGSQPSEGRIRRRWGHLEPEQDDGLGVGVEHVDGARSVASKALRIDADGPVGESEALECGLGKRLSICRCVALGIETVAVVSEGSVELDQPRVLGHPSVERRPIAWDSSIGGDD